MDLNALAAQLADELARSQLGRRDTTGGAADGGRPTPSASAAVPPPVVAPRGVHYERTVRLGDIVDHTLLRPEATRADVERLCAEAVDHRLATVCVNPGWVPLCVAALRGSSVPVCTVVGFPLGASATEVKAAEAALAARQGAQELDMVLALGALRSGHWGIVERDIAAVVRAASGALVKVIVESAVLTPLELVRVCGVAREAGAHYVKTSTGFHAAGGATEAAVALMRLAVGDALGVKASGGVRDGATALRMVAAGATRIGTSSGVQFAEVSGPGPRPLRDLLGALGDAEGLSPTPVGGLAAIATPAAGTASVGEARARVTPY
ncbi:MAG TPA: deoxyribose-phosphate aldolase [Gemmatimonadaceae bacterium]|nr:deoxyribose-phosphate aldolase [Gemmatimonadaceae bacterium]